MNEIKSSEVNYISFKLKMLLEHEKQTVMLL